MRWQCALPCPSAHPGHAASCKPLLPCSLPLPTAAGFVFVRSRLDRRGRKAGSGSPAKGFGAVKAPADKGELSCLWVAVDGTTQTSWSDQCLLAVELTVARSHSRCGMLQGSRWRPTPSCICWTGRPATSLPLPWTTAAVSVAV